MKPEFGIAHAPGVVAVLDAFQPPNPDAFVGRVVRLRRPDGPSRAATIEAVRDHGATVSLFFRGLTGDDLPAGSIVEFDV